MDAVAAGTLSVLTPLVLVALKHHRPHGWARRVNPLIGCYGLGALFGNVLAVLPGGPQARLAVLDNVSVAAVLLSLPLLLFGSNLARVRDVGRSTMVSTLLGVLAVLASTTAAHLLFRSGLGGDSSQVAGLVTAVLIGGTPNMAAVKAAVGVRNELYVGTHTAEVAFGALYVLGVMTVAKPALSRCLRPYAARRGEHSPAVRAAEEAEARADSSPPSSSSRGSPALPASEVDSEVASPALTGVRAADKAAPPVTLELATIASPVTSDASILLTEEATGGGVVGGAPLLLRMAADMQRLHEGVEPFVELLRVDVRGPLLRALGVTALMVLVGAGAGLAVPQNYRAMVTILVITLLALAGSAWAWLRAVRHTYTLGQLLVLVFCTAVGMMADVRELLRTSPLVVAFVGLAMVGGVVLHIALAAACRIDVDTLIVTSVSNYCSPPFIGLACQAVGNSDLMLPGVTAGLLGYVLGNFLGIAVAKFWEVV